MSFFNACDTYKLLLWNQWILTKRAGSFIHVMTSLSFSEIEALTSPFHSFSDDFGFKDFFISKLASASTFIFTKTQVSCMYLPSSHVPISFSRGSAFCPGVLTFKAFFWDKTAALMLFFSDFTFLCFGNSELTMKQLLSCIKKKAFSNKERCQLIIKYTRNLSYFELNCI